MRYLGQIQTKSVGVVRFSLWLFVLQGVPHKNAAKDSAFGEMQPDNRVKGFVVDLALFISCVQLLNLSLTLSRILYSYTKAQLLCTQCSTPQT